LTTGRERRAAGIGECLLMLAPFSRFGAFE
jgi:hypothetical protein